jgi:hypothetical protein
VDVAERQPVAGRDAEMADARLLEPERAAPEARLEPGRHAEPGRHVLDVLDVHDRVSGHGAILSRQRAVAAIRTS